MQVVNLFFISPSFICLTPRWTGPPAGCFMFAFVDEKAALQKFSFCNALFYPMQLGQGL